MIDKNTFIMAMRRIENGLADMDDFGNYLSEEVIDRYGLLIDEIIDLLIKGMGLDKDSSDIIYNYLYDETIPLNDDGEPIDCAEELYDYLTNSKESNRYE